MSKCAMEGHFPSKWQWATRWGLSANQFIYGIFTSIYHRHKPYMSVFNIPVPFSLLLYHPAMPRATPCHQVVRAMLESSMKERQTQRIELNDTPREAVSLLLETLLLGLDLFDWDVFFLAGRFLEAYYWNISVWILGGGFNQNTADVPNVGKWPIMMTRFFWKFLRLKNCLCLSGNSGGWSILTNICPFGCPRKLVKG